MSGDTDPIPLSIDRLAAPVTVHCKVAEPEFTIIVMGLAVKLEIAGRLPAVEAMETVTFAVLDPALLVATKV